MTEFTDFASELGRGGGGGNREGCVCCGWLCLWGDNNWGRDPFRSPGLVARKMLFRTMQKVDGAIFLEHCVQRCSKELKNWPPSDKSSDEPGPSETNVLEVSLLGDTKTFSHLRNWWFEGKKKKYPVSTTLRSYKRITKIIPNISTWVTLRKNFSPNFVENQFQLQPF